VRGGFLWWLFGWHSCEPFGSKPHDGPDDASVKSASGLPSLHSGKHDKRRRQEQQEVDRVGPHVWPYRRSVRRVEIDSL
jgi:hypothetical protein